MKNLLRNILPLFLLAVLMGCSDSDNKLLDKLKAAVESDEKNADGYQVIDMTQVTDFEWDTLYVFHQNDDKNYISREIGFRWNGDAVPNLQRRMMFVKDGQVVTYMDYEFSEFPLVVYGCGEDRWIYPSSRAKFATFKYCTGEEHTYPFIPLTCIEDFQEMMGTNCPESAVK